MCTGSLGLQAQTKLVYTRFDADDLVVIASPNILYLFRYACSGEE